MQRESLNETREQSREDKGEDGERKMRPPPLRAGLEGSPSPDEALHGFACHPFAGAMLIFSVSIKF